MSTAAQYREQRLRHFTRFQRRARLGHYLILALLAAACVLCFVLAVYVSPWAIIGAAVTGLAFYLMLNVGGIAIRCPVCEQAVGNSADLTAPPAHCPTCRTALH